MSIKTALSLILAGVAFCAPDATTDLILRIQQNIENGDNQAARRQLEQGLRTYPQEPGLYNLLGIVEAQAGHYRKAETAFRKTVERAPRFTGAWLNLGWLYQEHRTEDPHAAEKSLDVYRSVLQYEPGNQEANYQAAALLTSRGDFRTSMEHLAQLSADEQDRPRALSIRCANQTGLGDFAEAKATAGKLLDHPQLSEQDVADILPALEALDRDAIRTALLEGLQRRHLASARSLRYLAAIYERRGRFAEARAVLEEAGGSGVNTPLLVDLARVAYKQSDLNGALGYLAHARDLEPRNAGVHFFFGMIAVEMDLPLEARKSLEEAVRLDPNNAWYNYALGAVAAQGRSPEEAVPYFRKYSQLKPGDRRGELGAGLAYFQTKNFEAAQRELMQAAGQSETAPGAHYLLGRIAMAQDDLPLAESELRQAAARGGTPDTWAELGLVYMRQRNYEQARSALDRALQLDAEGYLPNLNLLMLYQRTKDPRAEAQSRHLEEIKAKRSEKEKLLFRMIEVRPN